jgi:predicted HAD superfamily phosphohydrolase YqeG
MSHISDIELSVPSYESEARLAERSLLSYKVGRSVLSFYDDIQNIPFESLHNEGKSLVILDGDSTIAPHGEHRVDPTSADTLLSAVDAGLVERLALVSNNSDTKLSLRRADQLDIPRELVFTPKRLKDVKPMPTLIKRAIKEAGAEPSQTVSVGDGITDAAASVLAGVDFMHTRHYGVEVAGYPGRATVRYFTLGAIYYASKRVERPKT